MEKFESSAKTYELTSFEKLKEPVIPFLHEIWNWQGDKTVLPSKWADVVNRARNVGYTPKQLVNSYVAEKTFDPMGFFFLTYRSNAVGAVLAWADSKGNDTIELLSAVPGINKKDVEIGLLGLVLNYFKKKGSKKVLIRPFEYYFIVNPNNIAKHRKN